MIKKICKFCCDMNNSKMISNRPELWIQENIDSSLTSLLLSSTHKILLSIPLETSHANRWRQFVIISAPAAKEVGDDATEKASDVKSMYRLGKSNRTDLNYCILGVDTVTKDGEKTVSLGFVLKILWGMETTLDGDGGFGIHSLGKHFMFKPMSLQFLWTVIQTLNAITARLKPKRHSMFVLETDWVKQYEEKINSVQSCINEWNEMSDILSKRPMSPDELKVMSREETDAETLKTVIKSKLREIMKTVDLDTITSKSIRLQLEEKMGQTLTEYKALIDEEMLLVFGQMDPASKIFDFLYLGSEWNASNLEELNANGVTHILNVTREIDNFYPAIFKYMNIREYDVEATDLLQYWDLTYRFIRDCVQVGGVCLVHCKMGISRSASTVMAFAMKHFSWNLEKAMVHTKECRSIIKPNPAFRLQLVTYEGILKASRQRNSFSRKDRPKSSDFRSLKREKKINRLSIPEFLRSPSEPSLPFLDLSRSKSKSQQRPTRPLSWSPHSKFLVDPVDDAGEDTATSDTNHGQSVQYHCYTQLSQYLHDPHTLPCPAPISATPTATVSTKNNKRFYRLPGQDHDNIDTEDAAAGDIEETEDDNKCPAHSCLSQCTCDLELELSVSEIPVDIFEETPETAKIMKNLGSLPIHIRHQGSKSSHIQDSSPTPAHLTQTTPTSPLISDIYDSDYYDDNFSVIKQKEHNNIELDTAVPQSMTDTVEELSVKTLANMFDFRLSDPSMTKNLHKMIKESKVDTKYCTPQPLPTIDVENCSEC